MYLKYEDTRLEIWRRAQKFLPFGEFSTKYSQGARGAAPQLRKVAVRAPNAMHQRNAGPDHKHLLAWLFVEELSKFISRPFIPSVSHPRPVARGCFGCLSTPHPPSTSWITTNWEWPAKIFGSNVKNEPKNSGILVKIHFFRACGACWHRRRFISLVIFILPNFSPAKILRVIFLVNMSLLRYLQVADDKQTKNFKKRWAKNTKCVIFRFKNCRKTIKFKKFSPAAPIGTAGPSFKSGNNGQKFSRQEWLRKWNVKFLRVKFCSKKSTKW